MFALLAPICLCGRALTSPWAGREAEYAKQLEQKLITLEPPPPPRRKTLHFLDFLSPAEQTGSGNGTQLRSALIAFECLSDDDCQTEASECETRSAFTFSRVPPAESTRFFLPSLTSGAADASCSSWAAAAGSGQWGRRWAVLASHRHEYHTVTVKLRRK